MITPEFKTQVRTEILNARENYGGSDADYSKSLGLSASVYSRLKKGQTDKLISDTQWLTIARLLNVSAKQDNWKIAKTLVYDQIDDSIHFCQEYSRSVILVDDCGIGKTFCARHIIKSLKNAFYLDCSQCKTKQIFIRTLAKTVGVDPTGRYVDVKANLKYFLNLIERPFICLDEAGDLEYNAFLELKELWNATTGHCGWYMMGADGLRAKIKRGIQNEKVGYREIFSRFSDEFITVIPSGTAERKQFYLQLLTDVATVNCDNKELIRKMVAKSISKEASLRFLETLIKMQA